ncbi:MAG: hypothetical protein GEV03_22350 [Streptosporangiales bacterium]|nr:hypothetical protein [Streptosporangiales bacterium]
MVLPPPYFADAFNYFTAARRWPNIFTPGVAAEEWPFIPVDLKMWHMTRTALVLPTRVVQEIFGTGQLAYGVTTALLAVIFALGCYFAGRALFGDLVGVLTPFLILVHPYFTMVDTFEPDVVSSAHGILPDQLGAGLYAIGVACLVVAARRDGRARTLLLVAAGLGFGTAYLAREFVAFMFAAIPVFCWLLRIPLRRLVTVALPMLGVFLAEVVYSAIIFADPLARLRVAETDVELDDPATTAEVLLRFWQSTNNWHPLGVVFAAALAITAVGWLLTRDRRLAVILVWFGSLWVPLTLMSGVLDPSTPSLRSWVVRYWMPVYPALMIGALGACVLLVRRIPWRRRGLLRAAGVLALAGVTLVGYLLPAGREILGEDRDEPWNEFRTWLSHHGEVTTIRTDIRTGQTLHFYVRTPRGESVWNGSVEAFPPRQYSIPDEARSGPLFTSRWTFFRNGPDESSEWHVVWRSSNGLLELWDR